MEDTYTFEYHDDKIEEIERNLGIKVEPSGLKIEGIDHTVTCENPSTTNNNTTVSNEEETIMADTLREKMEKAAKAQKSNNPVRIYKHWDEVDHHQHKKAVVTTCVVGGAVAAATVTTCVLIHKHHEDSYGGCNGTSGEFNSAF